MITLIETYLTKNEISKYQWRIDRFIDIIQNHTPVKVKTGKEVVISLDIYDKKKMKFMSKDSDLSLQEDIEAFRNWLVSNDDYTIRPVWDGRYHPWSDIIKDILFQRKNTSETSSIKEGTMTPSALRLNGDVIKIGSGPSSIVNSLTDLDSHLRLLLTKMCMSAYNSSGFSSAKFDKNVQDYLKRMDERDKKIILKEFGEVISAIIICKFYKYDNFSFPKDQNTPLYDFTIQNSETTRYFSVKSLKGSGASIKSFSTFLENVNQFTDLTAEEREVQKLFLSLFKMGLHESVLHLANYVSDHYPKLSQLIDSMKILLDLSDDFTLNDIADAYDSHPGAVDKFYEIANISIKTEQINLNKHAKISLFLYPLMKTILHYMNHSDPFKSLIVKSLNNAGDVTQVKIVYDNIQSPSQFICSPINFNEIEKRDITFTTKSYSTSFERGAIGIQINRD